MTIRPNPILPAGAVTVIDALLGRMREDSCVVKRRPAGVDAGGAPATGPYTTVATVGCQVAAAGRTAVERMFGGQFGPETDYVIKLPRTTDVRSDDQIAVNGKTVQVISDDDLKSYGFELIVAAKATS